MKNIIILLVSVTLLTGCIEKTDSIYISEKDSCQSEFSFVVSEKNVEVLKGENIVQKLECDYNTDKNNIIQEDFNFDGYCDLFFLMDSGAMFAPGTYFRFNPETQLYEKWDELNKIGIRTIIDNDNQTLRFRKYSSEYWLEYFDYKWEDDILILFEHIISENGEKMVTYSVDSNGTETFLKETAI